MFILYIKSSKNIIEGITFHSNKTFHNNLVASNKLYSILTFLTGSFAGSPLKYISRKISKPAYPCSEMRYFPLSDAFTTVIYFKTKTNS